MKKGIYQNISMADYIADPCETPSLSRTVIVNILTRSVFHARNEHPRFNKADRDDSTPESRIGDVAHALLSGKDTERIAVSPYPEFRSAEAKAWRDAQAGKIVIKQDKYDDAKRMITAFNERMPRYYAELGASWPKSYEQTIIGEIAGVPCRIRIDALADDHVIWDYKTTGQEFNPEKWIKNQLFGMGYDIQVAFYKRVYESVTGINPRFILAVQEQSAPYDCYPVILDEAGLALANEKIDWAIQRWKESMLSDKWDGYTKRVVYASPPPWEIAEWEAIKARHEISNQLEDRK